jgi:hypothetical protein
MIKRLSEDLSNAAVDIRLGALAGGTNIPGKLPLLTSSVMSNDEAGPAIVPWAGGRVC